MSSDIAATIEAKNFGHEDDLLEKLVCRLTS